jgi:hypothetical protein
MFGGTVPLVEMLVAARAAGFRHIGLDLPAIDAHGRRSPGRRDSRRPRATGFAGTVAAEVLSDAVRRSDPAAVARKAHRVLTSYRAEARARACPT